MPTFYGVVEYRFVAPGWEGPGHGRWTTIAPGTLWSEDGKTFSPTPPYANHWRAEDIDALAYDMETVAREYEAAVAAGYHVRHMTGQPLHDPDAACTCRAQAERLRAKCRSTERTILVRVNIDIETPVRVDIEAPS